MSDVKIGDEVPVYWETYDGREAGCHKAVVLDVKPYTGKFGYSAFVRLAAPTTRRGWVEMAI